MGNRTISLAITLVVAALIVASFNNCSKVDFAGEESIGKSSQESGGDAQGELVTSSPPEVREAIANCAQAAVTGRLLTANRQIGFADTKLETGRSQVCEFGSGDNLSKGGGLRARYEQQASLNLPAGAVLCDLEMNTQLQGFRYDDVFFLTFNGRILASNDHTALQMKLKPEYTATVANQTVPVLKYDWLSLRSAPFKNEADDYCLGQAQGLSACTWPVSERSGKIQFEFHPELLIHLGLKAPAGQQSFGFVITGDDDPSLDCFHEKLEFAVTVRYYMP